MNTVIEGAQDCFYGIKEIIAMCKGDAKALEEAQSAKSVNVLKEATGHKLDRTLDLCELLSGTGALVKSLRSAKVGEKLIEGLGKIRIAFEKLRQIGKLAKIEAKNMMQYYRREVGHALYQRKMPRLCPVSGPPGRMIRSSWKEMFEEESKAANVLERKVGSAGGTVEKDAVKSTVETAHPYGVYKKADYHGVKDTSLKSKAPNMGQEALNNSVSIGPNTTRRVGIADGEIVVFDETTKGIFHGHVRSWEELTEPMRAALRKANMVSKKGKLK